MALAAAINMQPMKKIRTLQTVRIAPTMPRNATNPVSGRRFANSWVRAQGLARQSLFVISNCLFGMPQTDSTMEGDRFAEPRRW